VGEFPPRFAPALVALLIGGNVALLLFFGFLVSEIKFAQYRNPRIKVEIDTLK